MNVDIGIDIYTLWVRLPWWLIWQRICQPVKEMGVQFLGRDLLEKEMATHSTILAWEILWTEKPGALQSMGWKRVRYDLATKTTQTLLILCIKQITNENLLYSTGNCAYSMLCDDIDGKEIQKRGDIHFCIVDSLCCTVTQNYKLTIIKTKKCFDWKNY